MTCDGVSHDIVVCCIIKGFFSVLRSILLTIDIDFSLITTAIMAITSCASMFYLGRMKCEWNHIGVV